uniref:Serine/threonine protein phosphatase 2A 59 kDa regulatory subunit B' gamma putative n=1 Tax=Albugo laibachii Nc14 TaxID=890382 RepID=F0WWS2_9STRA|nr:serine/threonine protein phosphatase 2A 59 kDa regulatory subunit B' gamma putative [Albugo laibachii Nc14]|eukprot:CCA25899.1 serine/threonine protein phosphatase 2A 59 kDa regulatory subunit B' gamma putative [Albugo laibachii Nc14]
MRTPNTSKVASESRFFRNFYKATKRNDPSDRISKSECDSSSQSASSLETGEDDEGPHETSSHASEADARTKRRWKSKRKNLSSERLRKLPRDEDTLQPVRRQNTTGTAPALRHSFSVPSEEHTDLIDDDLDYTIGCTGGHHPLLSKRMSLIIPLTSPASIERTNSSYLVDFQAPIARSGVLVKQTNHFKAWKKRLMILKGQSLFYYVSGNLASDACPRGVIPLLNTKVSAIEVNRFKRQHCFEISQPGYRSLYFMAKSEEEAELWMGSLISASMPMDSERKCLAIHDMERSNDVPALEDAKAHQRLLLFRQKIAFCVPRYSKSTPLKRFQLNEKRLSALYDLNSYCESYAFLLEDAQAYSELIQLVGYYLFRSFPTIESYAPYNVFVDQSNLVEAPLGDASGGLHGHTDKSMDYTVEEQNWGFLTASYDLLLKAIECVENFEKSFRKEIFTVRFISQLIGLFRTPALKERQILKGVLHRLYYKLTHRRSCIRKEIANTFYEFLYESDTFYGIAELLEILGSIVNGFACPIKQEHVRLLERALIPLHLSPAYVSYHQQLAYCMIQYVSKDHQLFGTIVRGMLKYWPVGKSCKEMIFIVEIEELMEHVLSEIDFDNLHKALANRLARCMTSHQFQVAERAISFWNSPTCVRVMNQFECIGQEIFEIIKVSLRQVMTNHWNLIVRQKAEEVYTVCYNLGYDTEEAYVAIQEQYRLGISASTNSEMDKYDSNESTNCDNVMLPRKECSLERSPTRKSASIFEMDEGAANYIPGVSLMRNCTEIAAA